MAGVDVRGAAPGTRETDLLNPLNTVQKVNAIMLAGGSAFGLDAASGVMRYLEEHNMGYHVGPAVVPIVPAAILFDLGVGDPKIRPDAEAGFAACTAASNTAPREGNVGAGAGATVGKMFGMGSAMKSGLGTASIVVADSGSGRGGHGCRERYRRCARSRNGPDPGGRARPGRRLSRFHGPDPARRHSTGSSFDSTRCAHNHRHRRH